MKTKSSVPTRRLSVTATGQIRTYAELQLQLHLDLRIQHQEWVESNGDSPMCELYEMRLAKL